MGVDIVLGEKAAPQLKAIPWQDPAAVFAASIPCSGQGRTQLLRVTWFWNLGLSVLLGTQTPAKHSLSGSSVVLRMSRSVGGVVLLRLVHLGGPQNPLASSPWLPEGN